MTNNQKQVPAVVIRRLPRYYRHLSDLLKMDIKRISSGALSKKMKVTASQIRQDFNYFGGFGQQGYGYNVEHLHKSIGEILGIDTDNMTIIIGAGNLGRAIANHDTIEKRSFKITALFDVIPELCGKTINGKPVYDISYLEEYISQNKVDVAILATPKSCIQEIVSRLEKAGVKGVLNFAYTEIPESSNLAVENVHISDFLMTLSFKIKHGTK